MKYFKHVEHVKHMEHDLIYILYTDIPKIYFYVYIYLRVIYNGGRPFVPMHKSAGRAYDLIYGRMTHDDGRR